MMKYDDAKAQDEINQYWFAGKAFIKTTYGLQRDWIEVTNIVKLALTGIYS